VVGDAIEKAERPERRELPPAVIRVTLASMDEYNILLQNGLNFYDATFFPTEANISLKGAKIDYKRRYLNEMPSLAPYNLSINIMCSYNCLNKW